MEDTICRCSICHKEFVFDVKTCFLTSSKNFCADCVIKIKKLAKGKKNEVIRIIK